MAKESQNKPSQPQIKRPKESKNTSQSMPNAKKWTEVKFNTSKGE